MHSRSFPDILVALLITVIGGVIVAWYIGEGERFKPTPITIRLTSSYCYAQDFYVDGERVISSIEPDSTRAFRTEKGEHLVYSCLPSTNTCGEAVLITWNKSSSYVLERDNLCPISVELSNEGCSAQDFYVDEELVVSAIAPNTQVSFNAFPGTHQTYVCQVGTNVCSEPIVISWTESTTHRITRHPLCPISIELTNENCEAQDYYVDGELVVSNLAPNATANFDVIPGTHPTYVCVPGTNTCTEQEPKTWTESTTHRITRHPSCSQ